MARVVTGHWGWGVGGGGEGATKQRGGAIGGDDGRGE